MRFALPLLLFCSLFLIELAALDELTLTPNLICLAAGIFSNFHALHLCLASLLLLAFALKLLDNQDALGLCFVCRSDMLELTFLYFFLRLPSLRLHPGITATLLLNGCIVVPLPLFVRLLLIHLLIPWRCGRAVLLLPL